jgi:hypothetical protein
MPHIPSFLERRFRNDGRWSIYVQKKCTILWGTASRNKTYGNFLQKPKPTYNVQKFIESFKSAKAPEPNKKKTDAQALASNKKRIEQENEEGN